MKHHCLRRLIRTYICMYVWYVHTYYRGYLFLFGRRPDMTVTSLIMWRAFCSLAGGGLPRPRPSGFDDACCSAPQIMPRSCPDHVPIPCFNQSNRNEQISSTTRFHHVPEIAARLAKSAAPSREDPVGCFVHEITSVLMHRCENMTTPYLIIRTCIRTCIKTCTSVRFACLMSDAAGLATT